MMDNETTKAVAGLLCIITLLLLIIIDVANPVIILDLSDPTFLIDGTTEGSSLTDKYLYLLITLISALLGIDMVREHRDGGGKR